MQAKETTFQSLIEGSKQFVVPLYQRTYSWKETQLQRLWNDILERAQAGTDGPSSHFIGSVVLAPGPELGAIGVQKWIVVDGQQRLTTLMLLLCALRDHVAGANPREAERFNDVYLMNKWESGEDQLRLLPTQKDRPGFAACIHATPEAGGNDAIGNAYRYFRRAIMQSQDPADPCDPAAIELVIARHLVLVGITASADDNVYRIFESLNNTGLKLSQADLIRNQLFMCLPTRGEQAYTQHWLPMQDMLSSEHLELLMYLDLVLRGSERVRRDDLFSSHQERIQRISQDEAAVFDYLAQLRGRASLLTLLVTPEREDDSAVREAMHRLNRWGAQVAYPAVMALLETRSAGKMTSEELASALGYIESFLVRRMLAGVPSNNLNRVLQSLVAELGRTERDFPAAVRKGLSGTRMYWPTDDELRDAIRSRNFYWTGRHQQRLFVLARLEESYPSRERANLASAELTIEHVLPQTLTQDWLDAIAADVGEEDPAEVAKELLHTLGNLTLTGYNQDLSNSPFETKRKLLGDSNLEMNKPIAAASSWGPNAIRARAADLAERAIQIWPGPDETVRGPVVSRRWEPLHEVLAALPPGSWTSYSDLAEYIGSHPVPVASHLASDPACPNPHRVLTWQGRVADGFRWLDPDDQRDPVELLREEGLEFDEELRADPTQRYGPEDLASLMGADFARTDATPPAASDLPNDQVDERQTRFFQQLAALGPGIAGGAARLVEHWAALRGGVTFGSAKATSCFLVQPLPTGNIWPLTISPAGTVEVPFQWMKTRPPFDEIDLRAQFRARLNEAPGINLPETKLDMRPSFRIEVLADAAAWQVVADALTWFMARVVEHLEAPDADTRAGIGAAQA